MTNVEVGKREFDFQVLNVATDNEKELKISIDDALKKNTLLLRIYKKSKLGVLLKKPAGTRSFHPVAKIDCNDYSKFEKLLKQNYKAQRFMRKVESRRALPDNVKAAMLEVDNAFELGDGYYDLIRETVYAVYKERQMKTVVGYVIEGEFYYTEDPENEFTTDFFHPNGVRFDSSIWNY